MTNIIIACGNLRKELKKAMDVTGRNFPVLWMDGNHNSSPDRSRKEIQKAIDSVGDNIDNILLAFGYCGKTTVGLKANTANLIVPKVDDCLSMFLRKEEGEFKRPEYTYFLTQGIIESEKSLFTEYDRANKKYGKKRTEEIFRLMLRNYKYIMLIDTKAYDVNKYVEQAEELARLANLELIMGNGSTWYLERLLRGPYDDDFAVIARGGEIKTSHFFHSSKKSSDLANN